MAENHRQVWEQANGRNLNSGEIVHHIDGDHSNNDPENLTMMVCLGEHTTYHHTGMKRTERTKANISKSVMGHPVSDSTKKKIGAALTGHRLSESTKQKLVKASTGRRYPGKKLSLEHRAKISKSLIGNQRAVKKT